MPKKKPSSNLASRVKRWHKRLSPQFPDIESHDLEMILTSLLRRPRERMQIMFLKGARTAAMSFDESFLAELLEALAQSGLEVVLTAILPQSCMACQ